MFFKEVENFYICAPHNREGFDKLKIKMDSEKECQLKKNQKNSSLDQPDGIIDQTSEEIFESV